MAQKVSIPWEDGSGDNFYIDFSGIAGTSQSIVTSDHNLTGFERRKTIEFRTTSNTSKQASAYLTVIQKTDSLVVAMYDNIVSIYDDKKAGYTTNSESLNK